MFITGLEVTIVIKQKGFYITWLTYLTVYLPASKNFSVNTIMIPTEIHSNCLYGIMAEELRLPVGKL